MNIASFKTRIFRGGDDLVGFVCEYIPTIPDGSILVVTSKIAALAGGRVAPQGTPMETLVRSESSWAQKTQHVWITIKDGICMANAGVDESNGDGGLVLLPRDAWELAGMIRDAVRAAYSCERLGVIISDSQTTPLRRGVHGLALGYAGFAGVKDYRGDQDLFGRTFEYSTVNVADCLASAAILEMGEGAECRPLALITGAPAFFRDTIQKEEVRMPIEEDMYGPLFKDIL
jgi:F420-0:gamma-glutamyl ligase